MSTMNPTPNAPQHAAAPPERLPGWLIAVVVVLVLVLGAVVVLGIRSRSAAEARLGQNTERASAPVVSVVQPTVSSGQEEIVLPGNTQAFDDSAIYARTNGYLKKWYVDIGTHVKHGDLLADIETPEVDQQLQQGRADLTNAEANEQLAEITAKRWQNLLKTNSVSQQETDQAVSDLKAKQAAVASSAANVRRLEQLQSFEKVYAPFDGVITARNTDIGDLINAGSTTPKELYHMAAVDRLRVFVAIPENDSAAAQNGAKANLTLTEFPGEVFQGTIVRNSDAIDLATRTLNVEVDINNPRDHIKTGAYVLVHLKLPQAGNPGKPSLTIPANTLLFRAEGLRVGVVRNGHAELTPITIGRDFGATVEVVSGLQPGDQVISNPSDSLTNGLPVQVASSSGPNAAQ